jgi:hypothetical protein
MRALAGCIFVMLITLAACSGKKRPFADGPIEGLGGSAGADATTNEAGGDGTGPGLGLEPAATDGELVGGVPVNPLSPRDDADEGNENLACEADAGACTLPDAGPIPLACVPKGSRDCTSDFDNDCDGSPDNSLDDVCRCVPGTAEPCDEHPGLDGRGQCRAGTRTCVAEEGNASSDWGPCEGAQGPQAADSCVPQDDGDCDGSANEGCDCVDGVVQSCGPSNDLGVCQRGTQTCTGGSFGSCVGATFGTARDCRSNADNDCDGRLDNVLDNVCVCTIGQSQPCGQHPGQDGVGRCRAGSQQCFAGQNNSSSFFGACNGSVGPAQRDACTSVNDDDCDGFTNDGCQCVSSRGNADCSSNSDASRCNGATGQCVPCQSNADCSLVSGGRSVCQAGQCVAPIRPLGESCTNDNQCESGECDPFYRDNDRDSFAPQGAVAESFCSVVGFTKPQYTRLAPTGRNIDCLDTNIEVNPGQAAFFTMPAGSVGFDYNCDDDEEKNFQVIIDEDVCDADGTDGSCIAQGIVEDTPCGETMIAGSCVADGPSSCRLFFADGIGTRACH